MFKLGKTLATSVAAFGLCGGLALLTGCHDKEEACNSCEQPRCSACGDEVITAPDSTVSESVSEEPINTNYVGEGDQSAPAAVQPAPVEQRADLRVEELRHKRDRLQQIEAEKILYPERVAQLTDEEAQIDRDLRAIEADMNKETKVPASYDTIESNNIQVRDQSNLGKPAEPLPPQSAQPPPASPDNSAPATAAPLPEPSAQPEPQAAPPAEPLPSAQPAPAPNADQRSELLLNDPELLQACQKLGQEMDEQKNASNSEPKSDETVPYPTSSENSENYVK